MPKWKVSLIGNPSHLRTLVNLGVGVSEESSGFVLRHSDLDDQTDGAVVRERAIKMVEALNGLGRLAASTFHPVTVGGVGATHDGGIIVVPAPVETRIGTAEPRVVISDPATGRPILASPPPHFAKWLALAMRDSKVHRALQFFTVTPASPESLWKVYEVIRDDVGAKASVISIGWATEDQIDSFRSVHYPSALGDKARHGVEPSRPAPRNPMSLAEAQAFITHLFEQWLASK